MSAEETIRPSSDGASSPRRAGRIEVAAWPRLARLPRGTPLGRRTGLLGAGLLVAGFNTGNNLFYLVFTVMAASELMGFFVAGRSLGGLRAELIASRRARAGSPLRVTIRLRNSRTRLPVPSLLWRLRSSEGDEVEVWTPALDPGGTGEGTARVVPARRGRVRFEHAEAWSDYPLGLARRLVTIRPLAPVEVIVTPRLTPGTRAEAGSRRGDVRGLASPKGTGEEPLEAREYREGDDARWIDWRASARTDRVMWRDRRGEPPRALRIQLDRSGGEGVAFEARVSRAAGSAVAALSLGRPVGLVSDEGELLPRSGPSQRRRILDYLALVRPHRADSAPRSIATVDGREVGTDERDRSERGAGVDLT